MNRIYSASENRTERSISVWPGKKGPVPSAYLQKSFSICIWPETYYGSLPTSATQNQYSLHYSIQRRTQWLSKSILLRRSPVSPTSRKLLRLLLPVKEIVGASQKNLSAPLSCLPLIQMTGREIWQAGFLSVQYLVLLVFRYRLLYLHTCRWGRGNARRDWCCCSWCLEAIWQVFSVLRSQQAIGQERIGPRFTHTNAFFQQRDGFRTVPTFPRETMTISMTNAQPCLIPQAGWDLIFGTEAIFSGLRMRTLLFRWTLSWANVWRQKAFDMSDDWWCEQKVKYYFDLFRHVEHPSTNRGAERPIFPYWAIFSKSNCIQSASIFSSLWIRLIRNKSSTHSIPLFLKNLLMKIFS